jgi:hypothetical protein
MLVSLALVCAVGIIGAPALAQGRTTIQDEAPGVMLAQATPEFAELIGRWVRTDGGYTIVIKSVDPNGKIDATYANPNPINISRAEASVEGSSLRIFIELRGAGYPGPPTRSHMSRQGIASRENTSRRPYGRNST